ncbi:MAG: RNA polymerase subunit sigma-54 [Fusobacterium sp.]|nr:RNA polymerase subunit sigma-54 [Fusobacterium sp.]
MELKLEISQKQKLRLSQEMKLSFQILSLPYSKVLKIWNKQFKKKSGNIDENYIENIEEENNFFDYLKEQLIYFNISEKIKKNLIYCINNLNNQGFLELSDLELSQQLKIGMKGLEETFKYLHELEPIGVGTHNFKECIRLQLKKKNMWEEKIQDVLDNLDYIARGKEQELLDKIKISEEDLGNFLIKIKSCNPKPSRGFSVGKIQTIIPDFYLYIKNNEVIIKENEQWKDKLYNMYNIEDNETELLRYCIEKRIKTLKNILTYILDKQKNYFLNNANLETLHEKEIAEKLNLSISTISRAIQNKYIWTEQGITSFKALFCYSEERKLVEEMIEKLLEEEDKKRPLSDLQLAEKITKKLKYSVARRTITKYRKELGYFSSRQRKVYL